MASDLPAQSEHLSHENHERGAHYAGFVSKNVGDENSKKSVGQVVALEISLGLNIESTGGISCHCQDR